MTDKEFWQQTFTMSLSRGDGPERATKVADMALAESPADPNPGEDEDWFPEFYGAICNAVYRGTHPGIEEDGLMHTSDLSRATANRIVDVLDDYLGGSHD